MIDVLYEDNHLIIVTKPVNVPVQLDDSNDMDLLTMVKEYIKEKYNKPGNVYVGLIHRLDRPVGGAIVFAKTSKAASRMSNLLRKKAMEREYLAIAHGQVMKNHDSLTHYLWKDRKQNQVYVRRKEDKAAKIAKLQYDVLDRKKPYTMVKVALETGRSHQIRVQFQAIGHPLYGDQKYGSTLNKPGQQIALWSHILRFEHPVKKEEVFITSNPPNEYPWNLFRK